MKFPVITAFATLAALTSAFDVSVTFYGENNEDSYSLLVPTDRTPVQIGTLLIYGFYCFRGKF